MSPPVPVGADDLPAGAELLVGDGLLVPCVDGRDRPYLNLDSAASTSAHPAVARAVEDFLPWYSSVHRGAGYKSRRSTVAYEQARSAALAFAGREPDGDDLAILCRNTTEAVNHLAYRLRLTAEDVVVTTVVEHHANLLPWARMCRRRFVECLTDGTFGLADVVAALDAPPRPRLLAITGASNVTGWFPDLEAIIGAAHDREVPVFVDAAQLAPHRPIPAEADYVAWSGHKMYAPYGAGVLVGPRATFSDGDPFLAGGGAVDLVDLDEVTWTEPPSGRKPARPTSSAPSPSKRRSGSSPGSAGPPSPPMTTSWPGALRAGLAALEGVHVLGPEPRHARLCQWRASRSTACTTPSSPLD